MRLILAAIAGFAIAMLTAPMPTSKSDCGIQKVDQKTVTSFVLKPPPSPVIKEACPPVEHVVCPAPEEKPVEEKPRRRHRRHWR